jgi:hypothetical protein
MYYEEQAAKVIQALVGEEDGMTNSGCTSRVNV